MVRGLALILMLHAVAARAGTLIGKLDLPAPPERPPPATHGFLDRTENPLAPLKPYSVTPLLVIELDGDEKPAAPPQITWKLVGDSFERPVIAVPAGAEVIIRDESKTARTLAAKEDGKLVPPGPVNPSGTKEFRAGDAGKVYTIGDATAPHLKGVLIVVNTAFVAYPDELGRFEIADVPPGSYKLRIWYGGKLIDRPDDDITIAAKGKTDFNPKVPAGLPVRK